jgi:tetratricopeptide (TPR) repeat protein
MMVKQEIIFAMKNYLITACIIFAACNPAAKNPSAETIESINLKKGNLVWCGPETANFGSVNFVISADPNVKKEFNQAVAILHSFEYDEAEKAFASVIEKDPSCAMAYWGVAMSNFHPLWEPPQEHELVKGARAIEIAQGVSGKSKRETDYINALATFYKDWKTVAHATRCKNYEKAMEGIYKKYPDDSEAAIFYALALNTTADPRDKTYSNQKKAGEILNAVAARQPNHPGIIHYIIHNYDNPDLAELALPAARKYASVAPASAHAQHMPSHIFIRRGLWDEAISSNIASVDAARCYTEKASLAGNFDEELHGLDYLMYAYLQKGDNEHALEQLNYLKSIKNVSAQNLKVAYAYAAIPARYVLENKNWKEAAALEPFPQTFPWDNFPWQKGITVFTRMLGKVHINDLKGAEKELAELRGLQDKLLAQKDQYKANQLEVQIKAGEAWLELKKGNRAKAEELMMQAADTEDGTMKHPVTPGEVLPARELLADMYMEMGKTGKALIAYDADLSMHPNRLNGLRGREIVMK